jgi:hypothetical protein
MLASLSVTSPDTINWGANAETLIKYGEEKNVLFSDNFKIMFFDNL